MLFDMCQQLKKASREPRVSAPLRIVKPGKTLKKAWTALPREMTFDPDCVADFTSSCLKPDEVDGCRFHPPPLQCVSVFSLITVMNDVVVGASYLRKPETMEKPAYAVSERSSISGHLFPKHFELLHLHSAGPGNGKLYEA